MGLLDGTQKWVNKCFDGIGASKDNNRSYLDSYARTCLSGPLPPLGALFEASCGVAKGKKGKDIWGDIAGNYRNAANMCFEGANKVVNFVA